MAKLIFGMNMSLDGYVDHDRFAPEPALFQYFIAQTRTRAGALYGRGLYELMRYWDGEEWNQGDPAMDHAGSREALRDFAEAWRAMPKWVVSRSLTEVGPNATLLGDGAPFFAGVTPKLRLLGSERIGEGAVKLRYRVDQRLA